MLTDELVERILAAAPRKTVGVLGDLFLDRYLDLDAALTEPSIETGLDAYQVVSVRSYPGALGTVLNNLVALGVGRIVPIAVIGDDGEGYELRQALATTSAVDAGNVFARPGRRTPTYCKPMLAEPGRPPRELNRLDTKNRTPTPSGAVEDIATALDFVWTGCDAWIVLDQVSEPDCGVVTAAVRHRVAELAAGDPARFVLADSRTLIREFRGVCVKPNAAEMPEAEQMPFARRVGRTVFGTRGERGLRLSFPDGTTADVPGYPVAGPVDIVGAGDSCSAGIVCAKMAGATDAEAAAFGNLVASITVQQIGTTGTATPAQVRARWREVRS